MKRISNFAALNLKIKHMKLKYRIYNWFWIMKNDRKPQTVNVPGKYVPAQEFINRVIRIGREYPKNGYVRKSLAWHVKDVRSRYPYKVVDYSVAKALYEQYWTIPMHIGSVEELKNCLLKAWLRKERFFVHYFRWGYPVKGKEGYERYYINGAGGQKPTTFELRLHEVGEVVKTRIIQARTAKGKWEKFHIESDPERITQYLYADSDQIKLFDERKTQYDFLQGERAKILDELYKLDKQIARI